MDDIDSTIETPVCASCNGYGSLHAAGLGDDRSPCAQCGGTGRAAGATDAKASEADPGTERGKRQKRR